MITHTLYSNDYTGFVLRKLFEFQPKQNVLILSGIKSFSVSFGKYRIVLRCCAISNKYCILVYKFKYTTTVGLLQQFFITYFALSCGL